MAKAVILHTIEDVKHCLKHGLHKDAKLISSNINVVYFLKYQHNLVCEDLCSYLTPKEFLEIRASAFQVSHLLLNELDQKIADKINKRIGLDIRYFEPLYSFIGTRQLYCLILFERCLRRVLEQSFENILVYEGALGPLNISLEFFVSKIFPHIPISIVNRGFKSAEPKATVYSMDMDSVLDLVVRQEEVTHHSNYYTKKNIMIFEPLSRLKFFPKTLTSVNLHIFDSSIAQLDDMSQYKLNENSLPMSNLLNNTLLVKEEIRGLFVLSYEAIKRDFCNSIFKYLCILSFYRRLHERASIHFAYWETPTYQGSEALILEYLMSNKVTSVIGCQSSSIFWIGKLYLPYYNEVVFNRCHYFLTQGTTKDDIDNLYPSCSENMLLISPEFNLATSNRTFDVSNIKEEVDITLFLTPAFSFLQTGNLNTHVCKQEEIIAFLESKEGTRIHAVVHDKSACAIYPLLQMLNRLKNVILIQCSCIEEYLSLYRPKLIILDTSQPHVEEVLLRDFCVILMQDDLFAYNDKALSLLKGRVHYAEDILDAKQALEMYFNERLEKKRQTAYADKYCNRIGLQKLVSDLIANSNSKE